MTKPTSTRAMAGQNLIVASVNTAVCTENLIRVDEVMESPKLAE